MIIGPRVVQIIVIESYFLILGQFQAVLKTTFLRGFASKVRRFA